MRRGPAAGQRRPRSRRATARPSRPTAAAASALCTDSRPSVGIVIGPARSLGAEHEAHAVEPGRGDRLGRRRRRRRRSRTSSPVAADRAPIRRTIGSSALRIGGAVGRQRLEQLALGRLDRLERARSAPGGPAGPRSRHRSAAERCGPARRSRRRRTSPSRGRPPRARDRSRSRVSGRPTSLFWLPSLRSVRNRLARTAAIASLVEVLAMLPVTPTTSGSNRRRQPAASAPRAANGSATRMTVTSPIAAGSAIGRATTRAAAPRRDGVGEERRARRCARPEAPTKTSPGSTSRESTAAPRIGSVGPGEEPPAGQAGQVVGGEGGRRGLPRNRGRRIDVGHGRQCGTGRAHRSGLRASGRGSLGEQVRGGDRVGRDAPEELERHHRHLDVADPQDGRGAFLDLDRDDEVRDAGLPADVADERVVEQVALPGAVAVVRLRVPDLGRARSCPRRRSPGRASGRGRTGPR